MNIYQELIGQVKSTVAENIEYEEIEQEWWGYVHKSGTLQAKRYFGAEDINEAHESPFVVFIEGPFKARNRDQALDIVKNAAIAVGCQIKTNS